MAELWKDKLNQETLREFALDFKAVYDSFQVDEFLESTMDETWGDLELMAKGRQITANLGKYLPADYATAIGIIDKVIVSHEGLPVFSLPTFIEMFGQDEENLDISIGAMERFTQYASAEFVVRPFIIKHERRMMEQMYAWSKSENEHVRRLASEGCRPVLPWGQALVSFKKDPTPVLLILGQLKSDPSLYVRKSVANNLNDISKTHPDLVVKIAKDWHNINPPTKACIFNFENSPFHFVVRQLKPLRFRPSLALRNGKFSALNSARFSRSINKT
jgi:3-methyladenine DNA glycosylase AlkC